MSEHYVTFKAEFHFTNENMPDFVKQIIVSDFYEARNEAIDLINPHFEEWNADYTDEVEGEYDSKYNAYIAHKENVILKAYNSSHKRIVQLYADEYADIKGRYKIFRWTGDVYVTLKEA